MMNLVARTPDFKYNPGFKEDRDLQDDFIVRKRELKLLLEIVEENSNASSNRHVLLIGPRGAGKTTLARRIQAELRLNARLAEQWLPIAFGEESYTVTSAGEFWLECIYHLQRSLNSEFLDRRYQELREVLDNELLLEAAVATIIDQAHTLGRRFLLIVENLNVLLEEQMSEKDAWAFRHTLQNHPEIMLLATATSSFKQIENDEMALFDQFKVHHVGPLSVKDCRLLWYKISGERLLDQQVRPIQILTGGNPRLITILAEFALDNVFFQLVNKLAFMIDQYTDYFKGQLDLLPSSERKVFVALLELWDPAVTREVARAARVTTNVAGAYLDRLERRGAVAKQDGHWQATERLFNIYYLMRRRGAPSSRVQALVRFMTVYYAPDQLATRVRELAAEACHLKPAERVDHYYAVSALINQFAPGEQRRVLSALPKDFFQDPNLPAPIARLRELRDEISTASPSVPPSKRPGRTKSAAASQLEQIAERLDADDLAGAETIATTFVKESGGSVTSLYAMALLHATARRPAQAEEWIQRAIAADSSRVELWEFLANLMLGEDRANEGLLAARQAASLDGSKEAQWLLLARASAAAGEDHEVVEAAFRKALEINPNGPDALLGLAEIAVDRDELLEARSLYETAVSIEPLRLSTIGMYADFLADVVQDDKAAERVLRQITERFPEASQGWVSLALHIGSNPARREEARALLKKAVNLPDKDPRAWVAYGEFLNFVGETAEAEAIWRQAIELDPKSAGLWVLFGRFLQRNDVVGEAERAFLKAIELQPDESDAWEYLGLLLVDQSERSKEAESALLEAMARAPKSCSPVHSLGRLYEQEHRFDEADAQYRKALELNPECGCALSDMMSKRSAYGADLPDGEDLIKRLLTQHPKRAQAHLVYARFLRFAKHDLLAAKAEILLALSLGRAGSEAWSQAAEILIEMQPDVELAKNEFFELVEQYGPCEHFLNVTAWRLHLDYGARAAGLALAIARAAFDRDPQSWQIAHTLATIHIDVGDSNNALALVPMLLEDYGESEFSGLIDIVIDLARSDQKMPTKLLEMISSADRADDLEPLVVAMRLLCGQPVHVAKEVLEVANDIVARVRHPELA